jgi:hypothetical protein
MPGTCIPAKLNQILSMGRLFSPLEICIKLRRWKTHPDTFTIIDSLINDTIDISQQVRTLATLAMEHSK